MSDRDVCERLRGFQEVCVCVCLQNRWKTDINNSAVTLRDVKHVRRELGLGADGLIKA